MSEPQHPTKTIDSSIWKRLMKRYTVLALVGVVILVAAFPYLHDHHETWMMGIMLLGGLSFFGGLFGIAVSLFFHLWHTKK